MGNEYAITQELSTWFRRPECTAGSPQTKAVWSAVQVRRKHRMERAVTHHIQRKHSEFRNRSQAAGTALRRSGSISGRMIKRAPAGEDTQTLDLASPACTIRPVYGYRFRMLRPICREAPDIHSIRICTLRPVRMLSMERIRLSQPPTPMIPNYLTGNKHARRPPAGL